MFKTQMVRKIEISSIPTLTLQTHFVLIAEQIIFMNIYAWCKFTFEITLRIGQGLIID